MDQDQNQTYDAVADQLADQVAAVAPLAGEPQDDAAAPVDVTQDDATLQADAVVQDDAIAQDDTLASDDTTAVEVPDYNATADDIVAQTAEEAKIPESDVEAVGAATEAVAADTPADASEPAEPVAPTTVLDAAAITERVADFLAAVFYVATEDGDQPRVRPFDSAIVEGGVVYFVTSRDKDVYNQLLTNPKVEIFAMNEDGVLRIAGTATEVQDTELTKSILQRSGKYSGDANLVAFATTGVTGELTIPDGTKAQIAL
jgi:uncharacterized pyridoxamine 5'-phosphate oxidase family protein